MPAEHSTRRRVIYFDILRIVAIFFVVFVHLAAQHWADVDVSSRAWFAFNLYCTTGKWSVPIFVMISGALFLGRDVSISSILKKNVARIATVFLFCLSSRAAFGRAFATRHGALSPLVSLYDRGTVSAHPTAAADRTKRNAHALLSDARFDLHLSSPPACPVLLLRFA